jgi:membrane protein required for colicin V production
MEWLAQATSFDVLVAVIFLAFVIRGIWIGFISQISSLVAMIGGFVLAGYFDEEFYQLVLPFITKSHTTFLITYFLLFLLFFFLIKLLGWLLKKVVDISLSVWFDRTVGGLFGVIKGLFFISVLFMAINSYISGSNKFLKKSYSYPILVKSSEMIQQLIRDHNLRSYFIPKEPAIERFKESLPSLDTFKKPEPPDAKHAEPDEEVPAEPDSDQATGKKGVLL